MRIKSLIFDTALIVLFIIALVLTGCEKKEEAELPEGITKADTSQIVPPEKEGLKHKKETGLEKDLKALIAAVDKKEQELLNKEQELKQRETEIAAKETELTNWEHSLKTYRTISYIILILGVILFLIGLIMVLVVRKKGPSKEERKAAREEKKLAKRAAKESKNKEKEAIKTATKKEGKAGKGSSPEGVSKAMEDPKK